MNARFGYFPLFDMVLAFNRLVSDDTTTPWCPSFKLAANRLNEAELNYIKQVGEKSRAWSDILENLLELCVHRISNAEHVLLKQLETPEILFPEDLAADPDNSRMFYDLWKNHFGEEIAHHSRTILDASADIHDDVSSTDIIGYISSVYDQISLANEHILKFDHDETHYQILEDISSLVIMPSLYSDGNMPYCRVGNDYIFFIPIRDDLKS